VCVDVVCADGLAADVDGVSDWGFGGRVVVGDVDECGGRGDCGVC